MGKARKLPPRPKGLQKRHGWVWMYYDDRPMYGGGRGGTQQWQGTPPCLSMQNTEVGGWGGGDSHGGCSEASRECKLKDASHRQNTTRRNASAAFDGPSSIAKLWAGRLKRKGGWRPKGPKGPKGWKESKKMTPGTGRGKLQIV